MFERIDYCDVRDVDPNNHCLTLIGQKYKIVYQTIAQSPSIIPDILDIPDGILNMMSNSNGDNSERDNDCTDSLHPVQKEKKTYPMTIDILNEIMLGSMSNDHCHNPELTSEQDSINCLSFQEIISKYTLDFKQSVAFEIMASSFILKSLEIEKSQVMV